MATATTTRIQAERGRAIMKLAMIFEVPDAQADVYANVATSMKQHHAFAEQQGIKHWSFDLEMRPVSATLIEDPASLLVGAAPVGKPHQCSACKEWFPTQHAVRAHHH